MKKGFLIYPFSPRSPYYLFLYKNPFSEDSSSTNFYNFKKEEDLYLIGVALVHPLFKFFKKISLNQKILEITFNSSFPLEISLYASPKSDSPFPLNKPKLELDPYPALKQYWKKYSLPWKRLLLTNQIFSSPLEKITQRLWWSFKGKKIIKEWLEDELNRQEIGKLVIKEYLSRELPPKERKVLENNKKEEDKENNILIFRPI